MSEIRIMTEADLDFAVAVTHAEGWGYTKEDLQKILGWSPDGCFVLWSEERRAGMATTLFYESFGWVGNVVVTKDLRGKGMGTAILKNAISHIMGKGARGVRLFAYENTVSFYKDLGFQHEGAVRVFRRPSEEGLGPRPGRLPGYSISALKEHELDLVLEMDRTAFGGDRANILRTIWVTDPALFLTLRKEDKIVAFMAGKKVLGNIEVGPWVSTIADPGPAIALMDTLISLANCSIYTAIPGHQGAILKALDDRGFKQVDRVFTMSFGQPPPMRKDQLLSVGALEKG